MLNADLFLHRTSKFADASGYNNELQTSEMFSTAGRIVKSGLFASAVVSSWTWATTLLTYSGVAYRYGVSGPFWVVPDGLTAAVHSG
jgi:Na+/proline symporter